MITITEGSDELIQLDLKDNNDTPIDINDLDNIIINVTDTCGDQQYGLTGATGSVKNVNIVSATAGQVNFVVDREFTKRFPGKSFDLIIEVIFDQTDINTYFIDNKKHNIIEYENYIKIERLNK